MFKRMKDAAKWGATEQRLHRRLKEEGMGGDITVRRRELGGQSRITIVLGAAKPMELAAVEALEARLTEDADGEPVTLVLTDHLPANTTAAQAPAAPPRPQGGHDNPLSLPGSAPKPGADPAERAAKTRPGGAGRVIAVASGKGGVGKSTVAARLALALAEKSPGRVGLLDLDIYGPSLPVLFDLEGVRPKVEDGEVVPLEAAGLKLMSIGFLVSEEKALAWRGPMVMGAAKQLLGEVKWGELDWLVIDTPPGTGDAHLTLMQRAKIDGAVIVSTPSPLALADMRRGAALFAKMGVPLLGLVENMASLPDGSTPFGPGPDDAALAEVGLDRLGRLPLDPALADPIGREAPSEIPAPFQALADRLEGLTQLDRTRDPK